MLLQQSVVDIRLALVYTYHTVLEQIVSISIRVQMFHQSHRSIPHQVEFHSNTHLPNYQKWVAIFIKSRHQTEVGLLRQL